MAVIIFKVEVPDNKEVDIRAAFLSTYNKTAEEAIVDFVRNIYTTAMVSAEVEVARVKALADVDKVIIKTGVIDD